MSGSRKCVPSLAMRAYLKPQSHASLRQERQQQPRKKAGHAAGRAGASVVAKVEGTSGSAHGAVDDAIRHYTPQDLNHIISEAAEELDDDLRAPRYHDEREVTMRPSHLAHLLASKAEVLGLPAPNRRGNLRGLTSS